MADQPAAAAPARGGKKMIVVVLVVALCSAGGGFLVPRFLQGQPPEAAEGKAGPLKEAFISGGEVTVNLAEGRLSRYLRVKIVLVTDSKHEKKVAESLETHKAALRNWLIAHLSDKTLQDVTGKASINRTRREILDHYNAALFPGGTGPLRDVLFEEFVVQ